MNSPVPTAVENIALSDEMSLSDALLLATRLHRLGQVRPARQIYERVLEAAPEHPDALQFLGMLRYAGGEREAGMGLIRQSIAINPAAPGAHVNLGNMLIDQGCFEEGAAAYERAAALAAPSAELLNNLGVLRRHQGRIDDAETAYRQAIAIDERFADAYNNLGHLYAARGRHEEALQEYCKALALHPANPESRRITALALCMVGRADAAADIYRQWLHDEPDNPLPRHYLSACTGVAVPERASDAYVEATFDLFASSFDAKLELLAYRAPALVADAVRAIVGVRENALSVLDAGCGTGLCGPLLAPYAQRLVGVDLSGGMLAKAKARGVYDALEKAELVRFLRGAPATFDLVVSADTLCYFGPLEAVADAAYAALRPGGWLVFTVEALRSASAGAGHLLNAHGRYSHARGYLEDVLAAAGYDQPHFADEILRNEGGRPVRGYVVSSRRPD